MHLIPIPTPSFNLKCLPTRIGSTIVIYEIYRNLKESHNRYYNFKNEQRLQKTLSLNDQNYTGIIF